MEVNKRRVGTNNNKNSSAVAAGSVWESRMKSDEVKGGIKVYNGEENSEEGNDSNDNNGEGTTTLQVYRRSKVTQNSVKRKTWNNSEGFEGVNRSPIQTPKGKLDFPKESSVQVGIKKSPIQPRKTLSLDGSDQRSSIQLRKTRSEVNKGVANGDANEKNSPQLRRMKSESNKVGDEPCKDDGKSSIELKKGNEDANEAVEEIEKEPNGLKMENVEANKCINEEVTESVEEIEKNPIEIKKNRSEESSEELAECQEKVISSNVVQVQSAPDEEVVNNDDEDEYEEEEEELVDEEIEIEKKSIDIKEIDLPKQKPKKDVTEERTVHQSQEKEKSVTSSAILNKQPSYVKRSAFYSNFNKSTPNLTKPTINYTKPTSNFIKPTSNFTKPAANYTKPTPVQKAYECQSIPTSQNRLQSLVELVMWRDVSRSAFVFGIGTFIIISSSYTKDLNISLISVISYIGLFYLALIFIYRSIICRGVIYLDESGQDYVLGEEEAIWIVKLVLPYLNEFLLTLKALFSGDPITTMKLAAVLFVLARCGSSITIWKMTKLGFFGVFTVPKICSSYSAQLTGYGKFWIRRFRDAWDSCTHKKAVGFAIFTLVWNLCSIIARIWAVFMLVVAVRCYQQSMVGEDWVEDEQGCENTWQPVIGSERKLSGPSLVELESTKPKKRL